MKRGVGLEYIYFLRLNRIQHIISRSLRPPTKNVWVGVWGDGGGIKRIVLVDVFTIESNTAQFPTISRFFRSPIDQKVNKLESRNSLWVGVWGCGAGIKRIELVDCVTIESNTAQSANGLAINSTPDRVVLTTK
jgi:hypothetical protein